ncbi:hypothetical protein CHCC20335_4442 [Bacillus paralicheniformis]|nr:hypothetical protein CHCC20335_4442 [Bacillus paralicheniformis]
MFQTGCTFLKNKIPSYCWAGMKDIRIPPPSNTLHFFRPHSRLHGINEFCCGEWPSCHSICVGLIFLIG